MMREERWREAIKLLKENTYVVEKDWELMGILDGHFKTRTHGRRTEISNEATLLAPQTFSCKYALGRSI